MIAQGARAGVPDRSPRPAGGRRAAPIRAWLFAAILLAGCSAPSPDPADGARLVVRVIPFDVQGQESGVGYLGRAFAESLAVHLGQSPDLRVLEVPEPGRSAEDGAPNATRLVTGTLARDGDSIQAVMRLLDSETREVLWETEVSSGSGDLTGVAYRMARRTIENLGASRPDLYEYIFDVTGGPEMSGSKLLEQALDSRRRNDVDGFLRFSSELVSQYPDDPAAHVISAWALLVAWDATPSSEERLSRLKDRLEALDRVDPASPYDDILRAYVYRSSGQPEQSRELHSGVLARGDLSSSARAWVLRQRSLTYLQAGNAAAARDDAEAAVGLDPLSAASLFSLSKALETLGLLDEAVANSRQAVALQPSSWRDRQRLGLVLFRAGRHDESVASLERACRLGETQEACANLAVTLERTGRSAEARTAAKHAESLAASRFGNYNLACYWALTGNRAVALEALHRSFDLGLADVLIKTDPDLDSLRNNPEFREIVTAVEDRHQSRRQLSTSVFPWQS